MFEEKFEELNSKLDKVLSLHKALPQWHPITQLYAEERGYETTDGLRKWCYNNLPPDDFVKKGKLWYINIESLPLVNKKAS